MRRLLMMCVGLCCGGPANSVFRGNTTPCCSARLLVQHAGVWGRHDDALPQMGHADAFAPINFKPASVRGAMVARAKLWLFVAIAHTPETCRNSQENSTWLGCPPQHRRHLHWRPDAAASRRNAARVGALAMARSDAAPLAFICSITASTSAAKRSAFACWRRCRDNVVRLGLRPAQPYRLAANQQVFSTTDETAALQARPPVLPPSHEPT